MYRANTNYLQPPLFSTVQSLPEAQHLQLEQSWAGAFNREFLCRLQKAPFVLYSDKLSRPNSLVNVLMRLGVLKASSAGDTRSTTKPLPST